MEISYYDDCEVMENKPIKKNYFKKGFTIQPKDCNKSMSEDNFELAPLPKAVPYVVQYGDVCTKQEGKTPMRYNETNAYSNAVISAPASDVSKQRDYFLGRLDAARYPKDRELTVLFNLYVDNTPKNYKEMIDAIKGGKYTIDPKIEKLLAAEEADDDEDGTFGRYPPTFGIIWSGPQPDRDGYDKASVELKKQSTVATDAIMAGDADAMKAAVEAFEAWTPVVGNA